MAQYVCPQTCPPDCGTYCKHIFMLKFSQICVILILIIINYLFSWSWIIHSPVNEKDVFDSKYKLFVCLMCLFRKKEKLNLF